MNENEALREWSKARKSDVDAEGNLLKCTCGSKAVFFAESNDGKSRLCRNCYVDEQIGIEAKKKLSEKQELLTDMHNNALSWHKSSMESMDSCGAKSDVEIEGIISRDYGFLMATLWVGAATEIELSTMIDELKALAEVRRAARE